MDLQSVPYYIKSTIILVGITFFVAALYFLQELLIPLIYAAFLAIIFYPVDKFLEAHRIPRVLAISLTLLIALVALTFIGFLIYDQMATFLENFDQISAKFKQMTAEVQNYLRTRMGLSPVEQKQYLEQMTEKTMQSGGDLLGSFLGGLEALLLLPFYIWLFLFYRELFEEFLLRLFVKEGSIEEVREVLRKNSSILSGYIVGKGIETIIVAILSWVGLYLMGIPYALLFGILAGILNLIPIVGVMISAVLPMMMALMVKDSFWYPVAIAGLFTVVQLIDNHLVLPLVVGPKISINAFMVLVTLVAGSMLWGVNGMVLSMPLVAMLKVIFDSVPRLRPWGLVLGSTLPPKEKQLREKE